MNSHEITEVSKGVLRKLIPRSGEKHLHGNVPLVQEPEVIEERINSLQVAVGQEEFEKVFGSLHGSELTGKEKFLLRFRNLGVSGSLTKFQNEDGSGSDLIFIRTNKQAKDLMHELWHCADMIVFGSDVVASNYSSADSAWFLRRLAIVTEVVTLTQMIPNEMKFSIETAGLTCLAAAMMVTANRLETDYVKSEVEKRANEAKKLVEK